MSFFNRIKAWGKNNKLIGGLAGGSIGLLGLSGFCGAACSGLAFPLAAFLASIGFGSLSVWLPALKIPLLILSAIFSIIVLRNINRQCNALKSSVVGIVVGGFLVVSTVFAFKNKPCTDPAVIQAEYESLPPLTKNGIKTIYRLWPELGRSPTFDEVALFLQIGENEKAQLIDELKKEKPGMFYDNTENIKWLWPFSNEDHGIIVTIEGSKPIYARCAIDALGVSSMYEKPTDIEVKTALNQNELHFKVSGNKIIEGNEAAIVSSGPSCDEMLFFADRKEFDEYKAKNNKADLKPLSLAEGLQHGVQTFSWRLSI